MRDSKSSHAPLSHDQADRLLDLLSTDDAYRKLFATDRQAAMAQLGYADASDPSIECTQTRAMASKDEIAASRDELRDYLTSQSAMTVIFKFDSSTVA